MTQRQFCWTSSDQLQYRRFIGEFASKITNKGRKIYFKTEIPSVGYVTVFLDGEGNTLYSIGEEALTTKFQTPLFCLIS